MSTARPLIFPVVVGIDLSLTSPAVAKVETEFADFHNPKSKGKKTDTYFDRARRLNNLHWEITEWVRHEEPALVVIEGPSYGSTGGAQFDRSGLWWMVVDSLTNELHYDVAVVSPKARAKYATGNGNSGKEVVLAHVIETYVREGTPWVQNDDVADALTLAAMGSRRLGFPIEDHDLSPSQLAAMGGVLWPL